MNYSKIVKQHRKNIILWQLIHQLCLIKIEIRKVYKMGIK